MIETILIVLLLVLFVVISAAWLLEQRMAIINADTFQRNLKLQDEKIDYLRNRNMFLEKENENLHHLLKKYMDGSK